MNLLDIVYLYTINFSSALKIDKLKAKRVLKITLLFIHVIFRKAQQIASGCRGGSLFPLHPQMILPRSVTPTAWLASAGLLTCCWERNKWEVLFILFFLSEADCATDAEIERQRIRNKVPLILSQTFLPLLRNIDSSLVLKQVLGQKLF